MRTRKRIRILKLAVHGHVNPVRRPPHGQILKKHKIQPEPNPQNNVWPTARARPHARPPHNAPRPQTLKPNLPQPLPRLNRHRRFRPRRRRRRLITPLRSLRHPRVRGPLSHQHHRHVHHIRPYLRRIFSRGYLPYAAARPLGVRCQNLRSDFGGESAVWV